MVRSCSSLCILQNASWAWAGSYAGLRLKGSCSFLFAVLQVPKGTRAPMSLIEKVVSWRTRAAISSLAGSFLLRACRSGSHHQGERQKEELRLQNQVDGFR